MGVTSNFGAAPTYVKIASTTLSGAVASYTFSNIPQGYTDLVLVGNYVISNANGADVRLQINGDTGTNYSDTLMAGKNSQTPNAASTRRSSVNYIQSNNWVSPINTYTNFFTFNFLSYSNSNIYKTILSRGGQFQSTYQEDITQVNLWRSTNPITSIYIYTTAYAFDTNTTFTIYGIKAALTPKATGGDLVVNDGVYWYHAFRNSGVFTPKSALTVDYLVIGGGGGGTARGDTNIYWGGGGGGAGQLSYASNQTLNATGYPVTIGAGGKGNNGNGFGRSDGSSSTFSNTTAIAATSPFGGSTNGGDYAGGTYVGGTGGHHGAGGAGAGQNGGSQTSDSPATGGVGGNGLSTYSSFGLATGTGQNVSGTVYFAGGGGGGIASSYDGTTTARPGGYGGGGAGAVSAASAISASGSPGTANTGGGGGGGSPATTSGNSLGGNGGSGLVIVRYPV